MGKRMRSEELVFGYKAFDPNFAWEQIQYKVGIVYTCGGAEDRSNWFGFCRGLPLDVVRAYGLLDRETVLPLRFAAVSAVKKACMMIGFLRKVKRQQLALTGNAR